MINSVNTPGVSNAVVGMAKAATNPDNLKAASNVLGTVAVTATVFGQPQIAVPAAIASTGLGLAAAVQDSNPVEAVVVEVVVNVIAKPIGVVAKLGGKSLDDIGKNIVEAAGQATESEYKNKIKEN
jgi:hypothetical protein